MDALLASPDRQTTQGTRDYATLLFLYNTRARASELAQLTVSDLQLDKSHKEIPSSPCMERATGHAYVRCGRIPRM